MVYPTTDSLNKTNLWRIEKYKEAEFKSKIKRPMEHELKSWHME